MTDSAELDDSAVRWSEPVDALGRRPLVVLAHGLGSDERDLFSLVPLLAAGSLSSAGPVFASLRAPRHHGSGYSWFRTGAPGLPDPESAIAATLGVLEWLDRVAPPGPVVVAGFSQGGALAIQLLRHAPQRFAAIGCLAGFVVDGGADAETDARLASLPVRPPLFWGRDPRDPVIPHSAIERTARWVNGHADATIREYAGVGHSIAREEADDLADFFARAISRV
jgi:phospholipase/carboxylesterase